MDRVAYQPRPTAISNASNAETGITTTSCRRACSPLSMASTRSREISRSTFSTSDELSWMSACT